MGLDLNKNFGDTISTKIRQEIILNNFINQTIDNNQDLKRLFRYMTVSPLSKKSVNKNGDIVIQKDLNKTLIVDSDEGKRIMYYGMYNPDMTTDTQTYCFIHNNGSAYGVSKEGWDVSYFTIEVLIPQTYDLIQDEELKLLIPRGDSIGIKIADLLDGYSINGQEYGVNVGVTTFNFVNKNVQRLSNTSDNIVYSFIYKAHVLNCRR